MDDLDAILTRLARAPVPASLDGMEAKVLARIAARPAASVSIGAGALAIAVAIGMGVAGAGVPSKETGTFSLSPLGPVFPFAPSTLLGGAR